MSVLHVTKQQSTQLSLDYDASSMSWFGFRAVLENLTKAARRIAGESMQHAIRMRGLLLHRNPCTGRVGTATKLGAKSKMSRGLVTTNEVQRPTEKVAIVDENNTLIGSSTRGQMRAENLIHRSSFVAIFNSQGELYVQKRVSFKETYPSFYDPAPGGVVGEDESYEESAEREIEEEMGVRNVQLQKCFDFYHADDISRVWGCLFSCTYDGTFRLDPEEVESGDFMSVKEVKELMSSGKVPPDSKACMEKYLGS